MLKLRKLFIYGVIGVPLGTNMKLLHAPPSLITYVL